MRKYTFALIGLFLWSMVAFAQPTNNDCANAIAIGDVTDWCSNSAEFTNLSATPSGFGGATCFTDGNNDVWFSLVAVATDISITVIGDVSFSPGGTLNNPAIALYSGECTGTITELGCNADLVNNNIIELNASGLMLGATYLIRINGRAGNEGTFQLCVNNFSPPVVPGADCNDAAILCDESSFSIPNIVGVGSDPDEAAGTCLDGGAINSETNSTWFSWTAANNGLLTFVINPNNPEDDLDFVVYELPSGLNDCTNKQVLRCMASGNTGCLGATGLMMGETDTEELLNCTNGSNNFLAPLQLDAGTSYALLINNYTSTGNGFSMSFGGNGEFLGPNVEFIDDDGDDKICAGESITFEDNSSFALGPILNRNWNFGLGAIPQTATGIGPHTVQFTQPGQISIALQVETQLGCIVTETTEYDISDCCDSVNEIFAEFTQNDLACADDLDGSIDITVTGGSQPYEYTWLSGENTEDLSDLPAGNYSVTIADQLGCDTIFNITLDGPPMYNYAETITMPTCGGGTDGVIDLTVSGATPPYTFNWTQDGMPFGGDTEDLTNLPVGDYAVTITDLNGCQIFDDFAVRELELILAPDAVIEQPSCNGDSDGSIELSILNGLAPYEFDINDGNGFTSNPVIENLAAGTYNIAVRDANMCLGNIVIDLAEPDVLTVDATGMDISCFGYDDGSVLADVSGGTMPYTFDWSSNGTGLDSISDLMPGTYVVTVTDVNGCTASDDATITEPVSVAIDSLVTVDNLCFGGTAGEITVYASGGSPPFQYSSNGAVFQDSNVLTGLGSGTITVTIRDEFGCDFSRDTTIAQPEELILDAGSDVEISLGFSTDLDATLINSTIDHTIEWSPATGLSCTDCFNPVANPFETTTYRATITTALGCTATATVTVNVRDTRPVFIPNAFSPNVDGPNDVFLVYGGQAVTGVRTFEVFDRWGGKVYSAQNISTDDPSVGWDGMYRGRLAPPGVYVYYVEVEFIDGKVLSYKGDVSLVR